MRMPARSLRREEPQIAAIALRVHDAAAAHRHVLDAGAWDSPVHVAPMELHIPAIHGAGASRIYFVDRHREFSIYDVDFVPIPGVERQPPALGGLNWFGIVQYIGRERVDDWVAFYTSLFGFRLLPDDERFGILPRGRVLRSPDAKNRPAADRARRRRSRRRRTVCSVSRSAATTWRPRSPRCARTASASSRRLR